MLDLAKSIVTTLLIGKYAFETYIDYRQYQAYKKTEPPKSLEKEITRDVFLKSQEYSQAKSRFSFVKNAIATVKELLMIKLDLLPKIWCLASSISLSLSKLSIIGRFFGASVISQSIIFFAITTAISTLESLPMSYYEDFVLEENFGFNKSTVKTWVSDNIKMFFVDIVLKSPFIYGFFRIVEYFGTSFISYACVFIFISELLFITILPNLVYPLFYKFSSLEAGDLKTEIEAEAQRSNFPLTDIYVIDASSRSSHSNAFFVGLPWSKKIVLFDTLIEQNTTKETVAVLTHEIGHWKLNHLPQMLVSHQMTAVISMALFSGFLRNKSFFHSFGFTDVYPAYIAYYLYTYVESPIGCLTKFSDKILSRKNEYQADAYAKHQGYSNELATALIKLRTNNLDRMCNDWLYSAYNHSHPTTGERLSALGYISKERIGDVQSEVKGRNEK
ncbi:hypothetical protein JCM33374_g4779 [Metschnikowia sp. JCM 33374]|nr:hypothetical protein JCM33374_g4779 [Metschnikowia sp. JCM 33374]